LEQEDNYLVPVEMVVVVIKVDLMVLVLWGLIIQRLLKIKVISKQVEAAAPEVYQFFKLEEGEKDLVVGTEATLLIRLMVAAAVADFHVVPVDLPTDQVRQTSLPVDLVVIMEVDLMGEMEDPTGEMVAVLQEDLVEVKEDQLLSLMMVPE
jgi:hypothetical protein